jgi:ABC-type amino acid transport substrate-binding protein
MKKNIRTILLAAIVLALAGVGVGVFMFNKKVPSTADLKPDFTATATDFYNEFDTDEKVAFNKYKDKVVQLSGKVQAVNAAAEGRVDVILADDAIAGTLSFSLEPDQTAKGKALKEGDAITLKGICTGIQSAAEEEEDSLLSSLGKEVQFKKGVIIQ